MSLHGCTDENPCVQCGVWCVNECACEGERTLV